MSGAFNLNPNSNSVASESDAEEKTVGDAGLVLLPADATRKGFRIYNNSVDVVHIVYETVATKAKKTITLPQYYLYVEDNYSGAVSAITEATKSVILNVTPLK